MIVIKTSSDGQQLRLGDVASRIEVGAAEEGFASLDGSAPLVRVKIERAKLEAMGVAYDDVLTTIHRAVGSVQTLTIHCFGQTWPVRVHADPMLRADSAALRLIVFESDIGAPARLHADLHVLDRLKFRNDKGQMVGLARSPQFEKPTIPTVSNDSTSSRQCRSRQTTPANCLWPNAGSSASAWPRASFRNRTRWGIGWSGCERCRPRKSPPRPETQPLR